MPKSGKPGSGSRTGYLSDMGNGSSTAAQHSTTLATRLTAVSGDASGRSQASQGSGARQLPVLVRPPAEVVTLNNWQVHGRSPIARSLSCSPMHSSHRSAEALSVEKKAVRALEIGLQELRQRLEAKDSQRRSLGPEAAVSFSAEEIRGVFTSLSKVEEACLTFSQPIESGDEVLRKTILLPDSDSQLDLRPIDDTERTFDQGSTAGQYLLTYSGLQELRNQELRSLHTEKEALQGLQQKLRGFEKTQRHRLNSKLLADPEISEDIEQTEAEIEAQEARIERLEQNVERFNEGLGCQEDDLPSETSSMSDRRVDRDGISRWRDTALSSGGDDSIAKM
jgi:hypothetical protein